MADPAAAMTPQLVFEAGKVAYLRGWDNPDLVGASQLYGLGPSGPPVILVAAASEITDEAARTVASLAGVGREVCVVTDGALPEGISSWLSDDLVAYPHEPSSDAVPGATPDEPDEPAEVPANHSRESAAASEPPSAGVQLPDDGSWLLSGTPDTETRQVDTEVEAPPAAVQLPDDSLLPQEPDWPDPYCEFGDPAEPARLVDSPIGHKFWERFVADRGVNVTLQPAQPGTPDTWAGRWSLFDQQTDGCLILYFQAGSLLVGGQWQGHIVIESVIGHAPAHGSGLDRPHSEQQRQFANQVTAFCEISEATAMMSRGFGGARWGNINDLRQGEDAAFGYIDAPSLPKRYLALLPADTALLIGPQDPVEVPLPAGLAEVRLTYLVPITADAESTADVIAHSVDAITRTHKLLWRPRSDLDGRRDPEQAAPLEAFLNEIEFASYGGAVQILWGAE